MSIPSINKIPDVEKSDGLRLSAASLINRMRRNIHQIQEISQGQTEELDKAQTKLASLQKRVQITDQIAKPVVEKADKIIAFSVWNGILKITHIFDNFILNLDRLIDWMPYILLFFMSISVYTFLK